MRKAADLSISGNANLSGFRVPRRSSSIRDRVFFVFVGESGIFILNTRVRILTANTHTRCAASNTEIRIHGRRSVLGGLVMGDGASPAGVPSFVCPSREMGDSSFRRQGLRPRSFPVEQRLLLAKPRSRL
ncbi:MAG: hypothetical protein EOQ95_04410 [Mesorhizobium sp.]|nr:MAG: hypothetical protein EOQ95_04410 [Mesorhizobium sp.]RWQ57166.1 MAG: hypothetical protein EOS84_06290 [Mesorhizobium sp.]